MIEIDKKFVAIIIVYHVHGHQIQCWKFGGSVLEERTIFNGIFLLISGTEW